MSMQTIDCPLLGLDTEFPSTLYVLKHVPSEKYGCYSHDGVHGLACFSTEAGASEFGSYIELPGMLALEVSFDEARRIAQARPMPIVSIMLLDDLDDPQIHYVR
ncbi:MAG TPA: hypothetical protein VNI20_04545 [Fimbriimonadaceae bacterium]|nr:hypothetical protein [Fimbriimonadaceae bacterium]